MHYYRLNNKFGFSLIEILLVVALIGIIAGFVITGFRNYAVYQQYNHAAGDIAFVMNQSKTKARSAVDDEAHGVKFTSDSVIQFVGDTYSAIDPNNIVHSYGLVTINPDLTAGVDEIIFHKLTGLPSATGTVTIVGARIDATTIVQISETGVIQ